MGTIDKTRAEEHFREFKRLNQKRVEVLQKGDRKYLKTTWYYPLYESYDLFVSTYPSAEERLAVLDEIKSCLAASAHAYERAELAIYQRFGVTFSRER